LAAASRELAVERRGVEVFAIICWTLFLCLRIVVLISALPTIMKSLSLLLSRTAAVLPVDDPIDHIVYIFIFVLVAIPMRGSIRVRIPSLMTRRRPRTMLSTHIGSSGVVSAGVEPGGEGSPWICPWICPRIRARRVSPSLA
jgi:hypothetical protein